MLLASEFFGGAFSAPDERDGWDERYPRTRKGTIIGSSRTAQDLLHRTRNDEARFRLAAIIESSDDAILSKDLTGAIMSWNDAATRMFGYSEEEIIGQPILQLIPVDLRVEEDEIMRKLGMGERVEHYETIRVRKDGSLFDVSLTISPIRNSAGEVIGTSKIARDISGRKQMERALIQSEKLATMGRMAATIAHEINNPLESVMNLIFLARTSTDESSEAHGYLVTAEGEVERVSHIARQTLGYYRETGSPRSVVLHEVLKEVLTVYQSKVTNRGILIEYSFDDPKPILANKGELVQVFSNIIANSVDAMPRGGALCLRTAEVTVDGEAGIEVEVRDQGTGIEQAHLERVFEPFFTTKGNLGTGIGLWVAKQLIEKRGGRISMTSSTKAADRGTRTVLFLPYVHEDGSAAPMRS